MSPRGPGGSSEPGTALPYNKRQKNRGFRRSYKGYKPQQNREVGSGLAGAEALDAGAELAELERRDGSIPLDEDTVVILCDKR